MTDSAIGALTDDAELVKAIAKAICTARGPEPQCLWHEWRVEAKAALDVVRAATVPQEANAEMIDAAIAEAMRQGVSLDELSPPIYFGPIYAAMIKAAALTDAKNGGWRDIATCPLDTRVLISTGTYIWAAIYELRWTKTEGNVAKWWIGPKQDDYILNPKFWMPLPQPPALSEGEREAKLEPDALSDGAYGSWFAHSKDCDCPDCTGDHPDAGGRSGGHKGARGYALDRDAPTPGAGGGEEPTECVHGVPLGGSCKWCGAFHAVQMLRQRLNCEPALNSVLTVWEIREIIGDVHEISIKDHAEVPRDIDHLLKVWPEFFPALADGTKNFELRKNDRDYATGNILYLAEWSPDTGRLTGRSITKRVTYVLKDAPQFGLMDGFCILGLADLTDAKNSGHVCCPCCNEWFDLDTGERLGKYTPALSERVRKEDGNERESSVVRPGHDSNQHILGDSLGDGLAAVALPLSDIAPTPGAGGGEEELRDKIYAIGVKNKWPLTEKDEDTIGEWMTGNKSIPPSWWKRAADNLRAAFIENDIPLGPLARGVQEMEPLDVGQKCEAYIALIDAPSPQSDAGMQGRHLASGEKGECTCRTIIRQARVTIVPRRPERIIAAAIRSGEMICSVPAPGRHHNVMYEMARAGHPIPINGEQGFLTSEGRFVDRHFGKNIAKRAGQVLRDSGPPSQLFSEDLW